MVDGAAFTLTRDLRESPEQEWWPAVWREPTHTLASAFRGSVVWYYQEVARRIGKDRMLQHLRQLDYGNGDLSAGVDRFWLQGAFTVSALEQVAFLDRLLSGALPVSPASVTTLREAMVLEAGPGYRWMGKTGWAGFGDFARPGVGWLVGWVERDGKRWIHAMNADIHDPSDAAKRLEITRAVLGELGLLGEKDQGGATF